MVLSVPRAYGTRCVGSTKGPPASSVSPRSPGASVKDENKKTKQRALFADRRLRVCAFCACCAFCVLLFFRCCLFCVFLFDSPLLLLLSSSSTLLLAAALLVPSLHICSPLTHGSSWRSSSVALFPVVPLQQVGWDEAQVVFCPLFLFSFSLFFVVVSFCPKVEHRRRR